jgi:hypothetical protein
VYIGDEVEIWFSDHLPRDWFPSMKTSLPHEFETVLGVTAKSDRFRIRGLEHTQVQIPKPKSMVNRTRCLFEIVPVVPSSSSSSSLSSIIQVATETTQPSVDELVAHLRALYSDHDVTSVLLPPTSYMSHIDWKLIPVITSITYQVCKNGKAYAITAGCPLDGGTTDGDDTNDNDDMQQRRLYVTIGIASVASLASIIVLWLIARRLRGWLQWNRHRHHAVEVTESNPHKSVVVADHDVPDAVPTAANNDNNNGNGQSSSEVVTDDRTPIVHRSISQPPSDDTSITISTDNHGDDYDGHNNDDQNGVYRKDGRVPTEDTPAG